MYFYYIWYPVHGEVKDAFFFYYLFIISIFYAAYKMLQIMGSDNTFQISPSHLLYGFVLQYLFICIYFFIVVWESPSYGIVLFFKSIFYIFIALIIWLSFYCFWKTLLSLHSSTNIDDKTVSGLVSLWTWFTFAMFFIFLSASVWLYNIYSICIIIFWMIWVSLRYWKEVFVYYVNYRKQYNFESGWILRSTKLCIDEFLYLIITFLLSINFVSVFRPFPIGWDDLWVYMNYPKLLSSAWENLALWKMYIWELYTWIWFLFWSQTFAFYLNSFSWVITGIVIYFFINNFTKKYPQKYNLWLLSTAIFLMMPMVIFQVAKDMKIDVWLFAISVTAISLLYYLLIWEKKYNNILYVLLGILVGCVFAIKVTSLLLLLWVFAALFYVRVWVAWFVSFIFLFSWVFSALGLWKMMNVFVPSGSEPLVWVWWILFFIWMSILWLSVWYQKKNIMTLVTQIIAIILWFIIALIPWIIKHTSEIPEWNSISITTYISGVSEKYIPEYEKIYSDTELEEIERDNNMKMGSSGTTLNEDFWRYFWYEQGINNFLKLPWNLTLQKNQKWEFTDITFLFLALIPGIFLFLPYRRDVYKYPIIWFIVFALLYFISSPISALMTSMFGNINLPAWYIFIVGLFLLPLIYLTWALDTTQRISKIFLINLAFLTLYMWLWAISSYGVVWYGIVMYCLLLLSACLSIVASSSDERLHSYISYWVLIFVVIYAFQSSIPHGITNLKSASYKEYKIGNFNEEVSLMSYHPEYFPIMYELNISDDYKQELFIEYRKFILNAMSNSADFDQILPEIQQYTSMHQLDRLLRELSKVNFPEAWINQKIKQIRQDLYDLVIYTPEEYKNKENIYRLGTFMKYFISENHMRIMSDNLVTRFDTYMYDEDSDVTYERMKQLDLKYMLIDLNAATIDRDPEKRLTQRYEQILKFVVDSRVELVETDSICLKVAWDNYKTTGDLDWYIVLAGVNHNSEYTQAQKRQTCLTAISQIIRNDALLPQYPYLIRYKNALTNAWIDISNENEAISGLSQLVRSNWFKALFKIN